MSFACTYAGQPVCLDHGGRLADLLETRWPDPGWLFSRQRMGGAASPFTASGGINDRITPPYPDAPQLRLNELIVPTGASRYARGLFVVDNVRLKQIVYDAYGYTDASPTALASLPADWDAAWSPQTLSIVQGGVTFSWLMYLLPPVLLDASGSNTLWLLPLVDQRYFWQTKGFEAAPSIGSTWDALAASLVGAAGTALAGSLSADPDYGTFDAETFADKSITLGAAIDAAAMSLGRRAVFDGTSLAFQTASSADAARTANFALPGLRLGGSSPGTIKPEPPRISGRVVNDHWPDPAGIYEVTPAVDNAGTSPERPSIRASWYVEHFGGTVDAAAQAAAQTFGDRLATDLLAWGSRQTIASFAGLANWTLSGHDDYLSIRIHDDIGGAAAVMRVASLPPNFRPAVNLCQRPGVYVHSHSTATGTLYEPLLPASSAELIFHRVDSLYGGSAANVRVSLAASNPNETILSGTSVFLHYQAGEGWQVVATGSELSAMVHFQLTAPLSGGTASAVVLASYATDTGSPPSVPATITVSDPASLFRYGVTGSQGWAWKSGSTYRVVQCDQLALQLMGTLAADASGGSAGYDLMPNGTATIEPTLAALTPAPFHQLPIGLDAIAIPNPLKLFGSAGDAVVLQFDDRTGSYFVLSVQKTATRVRGQAQADFGETTMTVSLTGIIGIDGATAETTLSVSNFHGQWGKANDWVRAEFVPSSDAWEIYQVDHHIISQRLTQQVASGTGLVETSTTLKVNGRVDPTVDTTIIEYTDQCEEPAV